MKFCPECGKKLEKHSPHCPGCGCSLDGKPATRVKFDQRWIVGGVVLCVALAMVFSFFVATRKSNVPPQGSFSSVPAQPAPVDPRVAKLAAEIDCACGCGKSVSACSCKEVPGQMQFIVDGVKSGKSDNEVKASFRKTFLSKPGQGGS